MRKALYILGELDEADIRWMASEGGARTTGPDETLIRAGAPIEQFFIIIDGAFRVELESGVEIARLGAGDILGEMTLVEKRPPSVSVVAAEPGKVFELAQSTLRQRLQAEPAFAARFYRSLAVFLSDRLRSTSARLGYDIVDNDPDRFEDENELDEGLLDNLHVAGDRLRRLMALLEGG